MADDGHPRLVLHDFFSLDLCKELEFIHKSCCTVGYRPNVFSTTLSHLIATNCAHLIMPFVPIRERLKEKVEEFFGCEYELVIEFTGLISWTRGASIGWHSDDNRPYLKQREYAAVCYLNTYGDHFGGGVFHFQEGEPSVIVPVAGDVAIYTADSRNIHSVDEITDGERLTLTLWFTRDTTHDEDAKLMSFLSRSPLDSNLPLPAANDMYWFPADQASKYQYGFDIRCARLHVLGFDVYPSRDYCSSSSELDSNSNFLELLMEPLQLARGDELFDKDFLNILHVLQVVQLHAWKRTSEVRTNTITNNILALSQSQRKRIHELKLVFSKDHRLVKTVFSCNSFNMDCCFDWPSFCAAVEAWEVYTSKLCKQLAMSLPLWTTHYSIFFVPLMDLAEEQP